MLTHSHGVNMVTSLMDIGPLWYGLQSTTRAYIVLAGELLQSNSSLSNSKVSVTIF